MAEKTRDHQGINRRGLLKGGALVGLAALMAPALSACGLRGSRQPAVYRTIGAHPFTVGDIAGHVLSDGSVTLEPTVPGVVSNAPEAVVKELLAQNFLPTDAVRAPINTVLFRVGKKNVLLDAGTGPGSMGPDSGRQMDALATIGLRPRDIDLIFITHAHPDHLFGYADEKGLARFPNAELVISEDEHAFWSNPNNDIAAIAGLFETARRNFSAAGDRLRLVRAGQEIAPGLVAEAAHGHTPGHTMVRITSGREQLVVTSDVANHPILFLRHPEWAFSYDMDPSAAVATRKRVLDMAATEKARILAYHFPFPGLGRVKSLWGGAYEFIGEPWNPV